MPQNRIIYIPAQKRRASRSIHSGRMRRFIILCLAGISALAGIFLLVYDARLRISAIEVLGVQTLDQTKIKEAAEESLSGKTVLLFPRNSFFLVQTSAVREDLEKKFPKIETANVEKEFPNTLRVEIRERTPWGIFCARAFALSEDIATSSASAPQEDVIAEKTCAYIDQTGYGYLRAPFPSGALIARVLSDTKDFSLPGRILDASTMDIFMRFQTYALDTLGARVIGFMYSEKIPSDIRAETSEGFVILFRRDDDLPSVFAVLKKVLDREIGKKRSALEYIDARFGNKVFYKWQ